MKKIELQLIQHEVKIGDKTPTIEPNIIDDSIFIKDGAIIGFYLKRMPERMCNLADIANAELLSNRVPKSMMRRSSGLRSIENEVKQFSTIIGSVPPKAHMRRPYPSRSSVHQKKSADTFVKAMIMLCKEGEKLIQQYAPDIYERQKRIIEENVAEKWRFGDLFTSSISNFNIAAAYHIDKANLPTCVNIIICKRKNSTGGNTTIPDYGATVDSADNSILVYPAVNNMHGVTPIIQTAEDGYRNTLVFYPLKGFK